MSREGSQLTSEGRGGGGCLSGGQGLGGTRKDKQHQENSHSDAEQAREVWMNTD